MILELAAAASSFLGSATLRWVLGEAFTWFKEKREGDYNLRVKQLEHDLEKERREWRKDELNYAAELKIKEVEVQTSADTQRTLDEMMLKAVEQLGSKSGIAWVDGWNHGIRPALASISIIVLVLDSFTPGWVQLSPTLLEVAQSVLGLYVGGRISSTGR